MRYLRKSLVTLLILWSAVMIYELILFSARSVTPSNPRVVALFVLAICIPPALLISLPRQIKLQMLLGMTFILIACILFITESILVRSFGYTYSPLTVFGMADSVLGSYGGTVMSAITSSWKYVAASLIPPIAFAIIYPKLRPKRRRIGILFVLPTILLMSFFSIGAWGLSTALIASHSDLGYIYGAGYDFDTASREFGLSATVCMDIRRAVFPFSISDHNPSDDFSEKEYLEHTERDYNVDSELKLKDSDAAPEEIKKLHRYVVSQEPTAKNTKSGIFRGKNLIFICAEALSPYAVSEELTPTLYKISKEGVYFKNYYAPTFGESTSGGEYALLLSQVPKRKAGEKGLSMQLSANNDLFSSLPTRFRSNNYLCNGYHNNSYTYYGRDKTHPALGMNWYGCGGYKTVDKDAESIDLSDRISGGWPRSDLELINATCDRFISKSKASNTPFFTYYLTVSGHNNYSFTGNAISRKNRHLVSHLPYSDTVKAYLAAQKELDLAVEALLTRLEEAEILDETVIVIANDHHPYGLNPSWAGNNGTDYLSELYGKPITNTIDAEKGFFTIYCHGKEGEEISVPACSFDVLPTLLNLFGIDFDSRLYVGNDIFSDFPKTVFFSDGSFVTDNGHYYSSAKKASGSLSETDISDIKKRIRDAIAFSVSARRSNYFSYISR